MKAYIPLLAAECPIVSCELLRPLRLASLAVGIGLLIAGSAWLPSEDWDVPICFVMALPAYVLAPWAFRQAYYFRWRWLVPAALALWVTVDGTYTLYWWLRGFDALAAFRPANFEYCVPLFWAGGFVWNIDFAKMSLRRTPARLEEVGGDFARRQALGVRLVAVAFVIAAMTAAVGLAGGLVRVGVQKQPGDWMPNRATFGPSR